MLGLSGTLSYMLYLCICVFVFFVFFVFACLTHGNFIFDILEQSSFQKYTTCWVFLALCHKLYWCICIFLYLCFWHTGISLFISLNDHLSKIYHMMGLFGSSPYAVFVFLCILYLCFLYLRVWQMGMSFLISLNNPLFKNIPHVGSFWHFVVCCICVFVYLCICVFVFVYLCMKHLEISV